MLVGEQSDQGGNHYFVSKPSNAADRYAKKCPQSSST